MSPSSAPPVFSEFIIYADESGDHGLESINSSYPVFVLTFCIFRKLDYTQVAIPALEEFKFTWWGHDMTILHGSEIARKENAFRFLNKPAKNERFMEELANLLHRIPVTLVAAIIDKKALKARPTLPVSPYDIALESGLTRVHRYLQAQRQGKAITHVIVEKRGVNEDRNLELAFRRVCDGENGAGPMPYMRLIMASKLSNSTGLQLADLVAHPLGRHFLQPEQHNRAYECIRTKLYRGPAGELEGFGLSVYPQEN